MWPLQRDVLGTWARVSREILGDLDTEDKNSRERSEAAWPFGRNVYGEREEDQKARQGAAGKPSQWEASPGETISFALTKACRKDSVFLASGCTLATPVPFGAWEHRGPELDISCGLFEVQFLERAGMHCQQALTALLVWWNTVSSSSSLWIAKVFLPRWWVPFYPT